MGEWHGPKFVEGCITDHGVTTVRQQQQPEPAGQTRSGCQLVDDVFRNGDFASGASYWTPLVGHDNANKALKFEATNGEM